MLETVDEKSYVHSFVTELPNEGTASMANEPSGTKPPPPPPPPTPVKKGGLPGLW